MDPPFQGAREQNGFYDSQCMILQGRSGHKNLDQYDDFAPSFCNTLHLKKGNLPYVS